MTELECSVVQAPVEVISELCDVILDFLDKKQCTVGNILQSRDQKQGNENENRMQSGRAHIISANLVTTVRM